MGTINVLITLRVMLFPPPPCSWQCAFPKDCNPRFIGPFLITKITETVHEQAKL